MTNTRAVVIPEPNRIELQDVQLLPHGATDVVVETVYTSVSAGTERMLLAGQMPHPMLSLPVVPGYETVGRIIETGSDVSPDWLGRWVYVGGARCYANVNPAWGGQSARLFADVSRVVPLDGISPADGVLLALSATALHGVDLVDPKPGQRLLVLGQGPVGQIAARIAHSRGAWVAVADRVASRLARSVGDKIVDVSVEAATSAIDRPVDVIIEASGSMAALADALPLLANGGAILLLGYYQTLQLPYMPLFLKEARLLTAKEWAAGDLVRCRDMIAAGTLEVSSLITHQYPISEVADAYQVALGDPNCLKLLFNWSNGSTGG